MSSQSTADRVLTGLLQHDLKQHANGEYRCNSPFRAGSNSHALSVRIHDGEHGTYHDHVSGESGSLYTLAAKLGIDTTQNNQMSSGSTTKRVYVGLDDYAQAHGVASTVFTAAGWKQTWHQRRPALEIPVDSGLRHRYLDGNKPEYKNPPNYKACWYYLAEAIQLAQATAQPLVICNGEASTIVAQHYGIAACTIPGGEKNVTGYLQKGLLGDLQAVYSGSIIVAFDCDQPGHDGALETQQVLSDAGYTVRAVDLNGGSGFDLADFCSLHLTDSVADLQNLPDLAMPLSSHSPAASAPTTSNGHRTIEIFDRAMHEIGPEIWDAVIAVNDPPTLFRTNDALLQLRNDDEGRAMLVPVDKHLLRSILSRSCIFQETRPGRAGLTTVTQRSAPDDVVQHLLHTVDSRVPIISRIVRAPVFAADGTLIDAPGYHASARLYYDPQLGLTIPPIPTDPTMADLTRAKALLNNDFLRDFPFVSQADRTHAIALFLLPYVRNMIAGPTPLHMIEAPQIGSGKGLLARKILFSALGHEPSPMTEAGDDDEWRKRITSTLLSGTSVIFIDNLTRTLSSGALAAALTTNEFSDRVLGKSEQTKMPVRCIWLATANNPLTSAEIARRSIRIRIDPRVDKPWERGGFKHDLDTWVPENRAQLIWAACVLVRYGLPRGTPGRPLGSFEQWASVMGRILSGCGITDFLGNLQELYDRADTESAAWRELVTAWWTTYGDMEVKANVLYQIVVDHEIDLPLRGQTDRALAISFGRAIAQKKDQVLTIGDNNHNQQLQIVLSGTSHKTGLWCLVSIEADTSRSTKEQESIGGSGGERGTLETFSTHVDLHAHAHVQAETMDNSPPLPPSPPISAATAVGPDWNYIETRLRMGDDVGIRRHCALWRIDYDAIISEAQQRGILSNDAEDMVVRVQPWTDGPDQISVSNSRIQELIDAGCSRVDAQRIAVEEARAAIPSR